jgi:hypothetical protein
MRGIKQNRQQADKTVMFTKQAFAKVEESSDPLNPIARRADYLR